MKSAFVFILAFTIALNAVGNENCTAIFELPSVAVASPQRSPGPRTRVAGGTRSRPVSDPVLQAQLEKDAMALVEQMTSLEKQIEGWSGLTGQYERTSLFRIRERRKRFIFYFEKSGELYEAVNIYRDIFKIVEHSYLELARYQATPVAERSKLFSPEEVAALEKAFGENYGDYVYIRAYLEGILAKKPDPTVDPNSPDAIIYAGAQYVLGRLGLPIIAERFENLDITRERPSLIQIQELFRKTPGPLIAKLKRDLRDEKMLSIKTFVYSLLHLTTFQKIIYSVLPAKFKEPVANFLGLNYNSYVLKRYLADIDLVLGAKTPERQLEVFREMAAKHGSSMEFYVTFVRLVSTSEVWTSIRNLATEKQDQAVYAQLLANMKKAEELYKQSYSDLAQFHEPSIIDHFTRWVAPAGIAAGTYLYGDFTAVKQGALDLFNAVGGMLPF